MKVMTILGTRPEIIRLSLTIELLDQYADHVLVHTGQNFDYRLNEQFFQEMEIRPPDVSLGVRGQGFADQIGQILSKSEDLFLSHRPDRLLILGDTNSGLTALVARRLGIPVYHMEAGNRCYDDRVPEEVNRRVIDHSSSILMPYTNRSKENLVREGIASERIYVTGNPIKEVIDRYAGQIASSSVLEDIGVAPRGFFLVSMHRAENVDIRSRLTGLVDSFSLLHATYGHPVVVSFHPRTRARVTEFGISIDRSGVRFIDPFGFFDFVKLEQSAFCILSDSGTVQEEACIFGVPNVTIRDTTERPETIECGSNILSGADPQQILNAVGLAVRRGGTWQPPYEYLSPSVSDTVCRLLLSYRQPDAAETAWQCMR